MISYNSHKLNMSIESQRKAFGDWLRKHREALNLSQTEAGRRAGMSRTQWTRLELGESGTKIGKIPKIARAVEADLAKTYSLAGFEPPQGAMPGFSRNRLLVLLQQISQLSPAQAHHIESLLEGVERELEHFLLENRKKRIA